MGTHGSTKKTDPLLIALTIFTVGLVLGLGLCGADSQLDAPCQEEFCTGPIGSIGFHVFLVSIAGFAITVVTGIVRALVRSFSGSDPE